MKLRKFQSVLFAASGLLLTACPAVRAADVAIGGVVRDTSGSPQMDVLVQLMRADSSVIQTVRTDARGRYLIAGVLPGVYQLKALETSFLPTLRENLRVGPRGRTEANLTLSTLLEALQWLPAHKRNAAEPEDDWTWTLRSAAYRPLLRFIGEDGIETIESPDSHIRERHGRLILESGLRAFGQGGTSETAEYRNQSAPGAQSFLRASVGDSANASTHLMAAYSRENSAGAGLSTVVAYQLDPAIQSRTGNGMRSVRLRTVDTLRLLPDLTAEIGNQLEMLSMGPATANALSPFATVTWTHGGTSASYVFTTTPMMQGSSDLADARSLVPLATMRDGVLGMEHGLHQELKLERTNETESMTAMVAVYQDVVRNPIVDGFGPDGASALAAGSYLFDPQTGTVRVAGEDFKARGVRVGLSHRAPGNTRASFTYATGSALTLADNPGTTPAITPVFAPGNAQSVAMMLEGGSSRTGTQWRTSYRWQPGNSVNAVDLFDTGMAGAYLNLFMRQSLHLGHVVPGGVDAIVDVRNLLAQGYHPFLTSDGNTLFFAQVNRSVQGGLAFYF